MEFWQESQINCHVITLKYLDQSGPSACQTTSEFTYYSLTFQKWAPCWLQRQKWSKGGNMHLNVNLWFIVGLLTKSINTTQNIFKSRDVLLFCFPNS